MGFPPFCSENSTEVYKKIIEWRSYLQFPEDTHLSREAEDVILRLMTDAQHRLNVDQLKVHPFFYGVDWNTIRNIEPPMVPNLRSITDTSYFPTEDYANVPDEPVGVDTAASNKDLAFLGYTFKRFSVS